jgi:hypothetical protein
MYHLEMDFDGLTVKSSRRLSADEAVKAADEMRAVNAENNFDIVVRIVADV